MMSYGFEGHIDNYYDTMSKAEDLYVSFVII